MKSIRRVAIILVIVMLALGCSQPVQLANHDSQGTTIICFGNSITKGYKVKPNESFPAILSERLSMDVINAGISGDTTRDALKRIEQDVLNKDPRLVIVEFGGNDFLQKIPEEETFKNMEEMITQIQDAGAMVVIAAVKTGLLSDAHIKGFKEIAERKQAMLIPNLMKGVFNNPKLKLDRLHPNAQGYKIIAERIYKKIKPLLD